MIKNVGQMNALMKNFNSKEWIENRKMGIPVDKNLSHIENKETYTNGSSNDFKSYLMDSLEKVNSLQKEANVAVQELTTGKSKNIHETMLAVEKADIAFRMMNQVRQKVLDAYKEVMRMQV